MRGVINEFFQTVPVENVEINVEHDRHLGFATDGGDGRQNFRRSGAGFEPALGGELVHETIGERIAEGHAEFQNIHARLVKREGEPARGFEVGVTRANVNNQPFLIGFFQRGKPFRDAIHVRGSFRSAVSGCKFVCQSDETEAFQREERFDGGDLRQFRGHERGVTAGGHDRQAARAQLDFQPGDQFTDQTAIAVNRADEHGLFGVLADDLFHFPDFDLREQRGFFMEIFGHGRETGGDDAARVISRTIHHVERDRRTKVHHHRWRAVVMTHGDGVGKAIGSDGVRVRIIDADATNGFAIQLQTRQLPAFFDRATNVRRDTRHHGGQRHRVHRRASDKGRKFPPGGAIPPRGGADVLLFAHALRAGEAEVRVCISDVQEQNHGIKRLPRSLEKFSREGKPEQTKHPFRIQLSPSLFCRKLKCSIDFRSPFCIFRQQPTHQVPNV